MKHLTKKIIQVIIYSFVPVIIIYYFIENNKNQL